MAVCRKHSGDVGRWCHGKPPFEAWHQSLALSPAAASWIVPLGCLNELNYKLEWKDHMCHLFTKSGDKIDVELHNGCPCVAHDLGARLLIVLEQHQLQQELKKKP